VAVIAAELPWLDRDLVGELADHGVTIIAVESGGTSRPLERMGIAHRLDADASADELAMLLHQLGSESRAPGEPFISRNGDAGRGRLIAVWGGAGSPGRTTVAVQLAVEAARRGVGVLLIDGDVWSASIAQLLGMQESPSIAQAAQLAGDGWGEPLESCLQQGPGGCSVLPGLARAELWPEVRERAWTSVLDTARATRPLVIVDLAAPIEEDEELSFDRVPYRRNLVTIGALTAADEILQVVAGDPIGVRRGIVAHRTLTESGPDVARKISVVVNRTPSAARRAQDCSAQLAEWTGRPPIAFLPSEPAFERVVWEGRPLHAIAPRSTWLRELHGLVGALTR
jgi:MinD-like ATPase involved in chromosome partitioning or flagellar assembly